jgi:hypothetical protein
MKVAVKLLALLLSIRDTSAPIFGPEVGYVDVGTSRFSSAPKTFRESTLKYPATHLLLHSYFVVTLP